jgi:hypothetical protein
MSEQDVAPVTPLSSYRGVNSRCKQWVNANSSGGAPAALLWVPAGLVFVLGALLVTLVYVGSAGVVPYRRRGGAFEMAHRKELALATRNLSKARKAHTTAIAVAQKDVTRAGKEYKTQISGCEKRLAELQDPRGRRLSSFGPIRLYERVVETPQGTAPLAGLRASVDTAGAMAVKSRATLTRMAAGGLLLGPVGLLAGGLAKKNKVMDKRELYILIESPTVNSVVQVAADKGLQARTFAAGVNTAAGNFAAMEASRPAMVDAAKRQLEHARGDTKSVDEANLNLATVTADPIHLSAIEQAQARVERVATTPITAYAHAPARANA